MALGCRVRRALQKFLLDLHKIGDQALVFLLLLLSLWMAEHCGRMDRHKRFATGETAEKLPALIAESNWPAQYGLRRSHAQADHDLGLRDGELGVQPRTTGGDLAGKRFLVFSPFSLRFPFEMLDGVCHIHLRAGDPGLSEGFPQNSAGGADEGPTHLVFLISRLFSDQDDCGLPRAFSKHSLASAFVEIASGTGRRRGFQRGKGK